MFGLFDYGWLNIGSLIFGLAAWFIPALTIVQLKKAMTKFSITKLLLSIAACSIALWFQIFYINHLVTLQDWTALMDTISTVTQISAILVIVTIALNVISVILLSKHKVINEKQF